MDQKSDIPNIQPEVNREEKKPGLWAGLWTRLGLGSAESTGGISAGVGVSGGILATKAGIIGLIVAGTTVAGSIGLVGYKIFGPTSSDSSSSDFTSIFQPKPKTADSSGGEDKAQPGGVSSSLDSLVKANAKENLYSQAKPGREAASASTTPPLKNNNAPSQGPAAKLKTDRKFGDLTKGVGFGSSGGIGGGGSRSSALLASVPGGGIGGSAGGGARAAAARAVGGRGRSASDAYNQLNQGYRDYTASNLPDYGKGRIYDGNVQTDNIGTAKAGGGTGLGDGAPSKNPPVNPTANENRFPPTPATPGSNVTPWQSAMNNAYMLIMLALALLFLATKLTTWLADSPYLKPLIYALASLAAICGAFVVFLGHAIGSGAFGQPLQGAILTGAGACIMGAATFAMIGAGDKGISGGPMILMYVCGGMAILGLVASYLTPKTSYPSGTFQNDQPPDCGINGCHPYRPGH